jgi:hypothetical protein
VIQCIGNHRRGGEHSFLHRDADDLLKNMPYKLDKYVIDKNTETKAFNLTFRNIDDVLSTKKPHFSNWILQNLRERN